jgi:hypothetical protein
MNIISWALTFGVGLALLGSVLAAIKAIRETVLGLQAKNRTRGMLHIAAQHDRELRELIQRAEKHVITLEDIIRAQRLIETEIQSLSARDRAFIDEGLHQSSSVGTKRYVSEILAGA